MLGDASRVSSVYVGPEGTVLVPGAGVVRVLGLTVDDAERRIRDAVLRYYRNVEVRVSLAQVRTFKVFVVGNVPSPGVRTANAATRVSELIPAPTTQEVARRNVLLRRASGDTVTVDLIRFRQTGDLTSNPTLREGDALIVPTIDERVSVYGRVFSPGAYEFRRGETLAQLLTVVNGGGPFPSDAADSVRLTRFVGPERRELRVFARDDAVRGAGARYVLAPFDAVYVPAVANYKLQKTATVTGQVQRPGTYPVRPETTTVRELVALAGGFTPEASLSDAVLRRQPRGTEGQFLRQLENVPPDLLTTEERRILQTRTQGDPTRVVIDFQQLFVEGRETLDQPLEAGDSLTVPVRRTGVTVLGAVANPGIVAFAPGQGIDYYVRLAGGYARRADRSDRAVLKARLGGRADARDARDIRTIDAGDQIIVPFRERARYLQTFQSVVATATGLILGVYGLVQLVRLR